MSNTVPGNVVRHFKGGRYKIIARGRDANKADHPVIIYMSLKDGTYWVRREVEFCDEVKWPDGVLRHRFIVEDPDSTAWLDTLFEKYARPSEPHVVSEPRRRLTASELAQLAMEAGTKIAETDLWLRTGRVDTATATRLETAYKKLFEKVGHGG